VNKQDRAGVRTAQDIERKYGKRLNGAVGPTKAVELDEETLNQINAEMEKFVNEATEHFNEMQKEIEENISYNVSIDSSNGLVFKNGDIESTLTAKVRKGNEDITDQFTDTQFSWTRVSKDSEGDLIWNETHKNTKTVTITEEDVYVKAIFNVILTLPE